MGGGLLSVPSFRLGGGSHSAPSPRVGWRVTLYSLHDHKMNRGGDTDSSQPIGCQVTNNREDISDLLLYLTHRYGSDVMDGNYSNTNT